MTRSMIDVLALQAQRQPHALYSRYEGRITTYGALWERTRRLATALHAMQRPPGERVAYLGKNTDRLVEILLGGAMVRHPCAVLNWRLAQPEWADILLDSGTTTVFADHEFAAQALQLAEQDPRIQRVIVIDGETPHPRLVDYDTLVRDHAPLPDDAVQPRIGPDDDFLQLYTSGTTGRPKGVPQTHAMHLSQREQWEDRIGPFPPGDCCLLFMPCFHAAGISYPLLALQHGTAVEIHRQAEPAKIVEALASGRIHTTVMVPTLMTMLLPQLQPGAFPALKRLHYGASAINRPLLTRVMETFDCDLVQIYAATETTAALTMLSPDDHRRGLQRPQLFASAGKPAASCALRIVDADGRDLPPGQTGEVLARSGSVLRGYWNNEAATRDALHDGWYHTGDLGWQDAEGYLYVVDRTKDMIISGGENVYSAEIERVLADCPELAEYAVVGVPDAQWGERVTACVVLKPGANIDLATLQERVRERLAGYKVPRRLEVMATLPRNTMGKLQKHLLRAQLRAARL